MDLKYILSFPAVGDFGMIRKRLCQKPAKPFLKGIFWVRVLRTCLLDESDKRRVSIVYCLCTVGYLYKIKQCGERDDYDQCVVAKGKCNPNLFISMFVQN
jgi:hypothetical protein